MRAELDLRLDDFSRGGESIDPWPERCFRKADMLCHRVGDRGTFQLSVNDLRNSALRHRRALPASHRVCNSGERSAALSNLGFDVFGVHGLLLGDSETS